MTWKMTVDATAPHCECELTGQDNSVKCLADLTGKGLQRMPEP